MRGGHEYQFSTHICPLELCKARHYTHTHPGHFGTKQVFARLIPTSEAKAMYYLSDCLVLYVRKEAAISALEALVPWRQTSSHTCRRGTGLRGVTPSQVTSAAFLPISLPFQCGVCVCVCVCRVCVCVCVCVPCVCQSLDCGWEGPCIQAFVPILSGFEHGTHGASGIQDLSSRWGNPT